MSNAALTVELEHLLAHREWVRTVARSLAYDAATADDLEQETWLEALRSPPPDDRNLRGWLGRVVHNRARKRARSRARRTNHEGRANRAQVAPPTADVVTEAEAQQRIVRAVLDLEEPYRTTILLRFYEGLPPREVGARMAVPAETVRTRVRRATAQLRGALGGEGLLGWTAAVFPLIGLIEPSRTVATATGGALAVGAKKTFAVVTLAGVFLGALCALVVSLPLDPRPSGVVPVTTAEARAAPLSASASTRRHVQVAEPAPSAAERAPDAEPNPGAAEDAAPSAVPDPPVVAILDALDALEAKKPAKADKRAKKRGKFEEAREAVRAEYERGTKGGFTFYDMAYWVDVKKLNDNRWSKEALRAPKHDRGIQLHAKWANEASAAPGMTIDVYVWKLLHAETKAGQTHKFRYPFDNIGESVSSSDVEGLAGAFYEDWRRGNKDVIESQCVKPRKCKLKIPKYQAAAVATDAESGDRVRREWYLWANGKERSTYVLEIRYGPALLLRDELLKKGPEFVKNLRALKNKRVRWPPAADDE